jgi:hypothetical protein
MAAKATVKTKSLLKATTKTSNYFLSQILNVGHSSKIFDNLGIVKFIKNKSFSIATPSYKILNVKAEEVLPFRVKFTTIGIEGYGPNNVPPIGIAVIGYNNYIL